MGNRVHIDFETRSLAELARQNAVGEHAYAQHASTSPLLLAYKTPEMDRVEVLDLLADQAIPSVLRASIEQGATFVAHNARFEQAVWYWQMHKRFSWPLISSWSCTAARARYWGLRASLAGAGSDLEIEHEKNKRGEELIKTFCVPRKRVKGVVRKPWATPQELPDEWEEFKQYCGDDVYAEIDIDNLLPDLPPFEQAVWDLDYTANWRGLPIDIPMVQRAVQYCDYFTQRAFARFDELTMGLRPTQREKVLDYCNVREMDLDNLRSKTLKRLNKSDFSEDLQEIIDIRLETAKASVKKLQAMIRCTTDDHRARGLILYYGAHTGRDSGKRVQPQNFVRGDGKLQEQYFDYLDGPWWDDLGNRCHLNDREPRWAEVADMCFSRPLSALGQSMRGFLKASPGKRFVIADYAQIEARALAWMARAEQKLSDFRNGEDLYCRFAASVYNIRYEEFFYYEDSKRKVKYEYTDERQICKSAELGCGFGLGGTAFVAYCDNSDIIITEERAKEIVSLWRENNPEIVKFWRRIEAAAILAVNNEGLTTRCGPVTFKVHRIDAERYWLLCVLPSGRHIAYYRPKIRVGLKWGRPAEILSFRTEWNGKTYREDTYGGKLTENAVQAFARDVMKVGVQNAENAGYEFILPVHDEGIFERKIGEGSYQELEQLMCKLPWWIGDCPITAEGKEQVRYSK